MKTNISILSGISQAIKEYELGLQQFGQKIQSELSLSATIKQKCSGVVRDDLLTLKNSFEAFAQGLKEQLPLIFKQFLDILEKITFLYHQKMIHLQQNNQQLEKNYMILYQELKNRRSLKGGGSSNRSLSKPKSKISDRTKRMFQSTNKKWHELSGRKSMNNHIIKSASKLKIDQRLSFDPGNTYLMKEDNQVFEDQTINPNDLSMFKEHITELFNEQDHPNKQQYLKQCRSKTLNDKQNQRQMQEDKVCTGSYSRRNPTKWPHIGKQQNSNKGENKKSFNPQKTPITKSTNFLNFQKNLYKNKH